MRAHLMIVAVGVILGVAASGLAPQVHPAGLAAAQTTRLDRPAYDFEEIADGVHFASGTGAMTVMSNSLVIVNADHVMLVDTSVTPAAARALIAEVRERVSDKPLRYVFNSHYHFDHAHGNQVLGDDVEIVGHDYVRRMHLSNVLEQRTNRSFTVGIPDQIERMRTQLEEAREPAERARLADALRVREAHWTAIQETDPTPPNITYSDTMIYLPAERIVFTGDFLLGRPGVGMLSYMGDGFVDEWPDSLERLKALDFDVVVPGHGAPFRDRELIDAFQAYLRDLWDQVATLRAEGRSVEEAVEAVDMTRHAETYGRRAEVVDPRAIRRIYELLQIQMPM